MRTALTLFELSAITVTQAYLTRVMLPFKVNATAAISIVFVCMYQTQGPCPPHPSLPHTHIATHIT